MRWTATAYSFNTIDSKLCHFLMQKLSTEGVLSSSLVAAANWTVPQGIIHVFVVIACSWSWNRSVSWNRSRRAAVITSTVGPGPFPAICRLVCSTLFGFNFLPMKAVENVIEINTSTQYSQTTAQCCKDTKYNGFMYCNYSEECLQSYYYWSTIHNTYDANIIGDQ